jgi:hypothetical protein
MKIVSQLDSLGYFVAPVVADPSPRQKGAFLIPGGAIDVPPPNIPDGKVALWQGASWAFVNPPEPEQEIPPIDGIPQTVSMRQARLALLGAELLHLIDPAIAELPEPQRTAASIEWEYAQEVRRNDPLVLMLAPVLGLDDAGLDALFTTAAGL